MPMKPKPLRQELQGAMNQRAASLRSQRYCRHNTTEVRNSVNLVLLFLACYPYADDERVEGWARRHYADLDRAITVNNKALRQRLLIDIYQTKRA